jgi:hypothetical protein
MATTKKPEGWEWNEQARKVERETMIAAEALEKLENDRNMGYAARLALTSRIGRSLTTILVSVSQLSRIATDWAEMMQRKIDRLQRENEELRKQIERGGPGQQDHLSNRK